jgi:hypothetical protein
MGDIISTKEEYQKELNDTRWHKKREKILVLCKHKCSICKASINLHVHHHYYIVGHKAWEYPNNALTVLCSKCHEKWHKKHELVVLQKMFDTRNKFTAPIKKCLPKPHKAKCPKAKVSEKDKQKLARRDKAKRKLIKSYGFVAKESVRVFKETKSMTVDELRVYLNDKTSKGATC